MSFEQKVGDGWRCDGCGKVERWGPGWRSYGALAEEDEGILRWVSCSKACAARMPRRLRDFPCNAALFQYAGVRSQHREIVNRLRAAPPEDTKP